jgi:hypothetical protein
MALNRRQNCLGRLDKAWSGFRESYAGLSETELLKSGVTGQWSVRDIIAHVTTWEEEALKHLPLLLQGEKPPRYSEKYGGIDAFNARMTAVKKHLTLRQLLQEQDAVHRRLVAFIERVPEEYLDSKTRFYHRLRLDTYSHYLKHAEAIRRWRSAV